MIRVKERLVSYSPITINPLVTDAIDQRNLWVHYDEVADSLVIYLTGKPERAVSMELDSDAYLKINPATGDIVGFHIEAWQQGFLPAHADLQEAWRKLKPITATPDWDYLLRMVALWLIFLLKSAYFVEATPQPA